MKKYKWEFRPRFKTLAFGWRSELPIKRIKEAVSEIKRVARKDPVLGAEGAVIFLEKLSPAIENVDGSSGAIGNAVNRAIEAMAKIIADAPAEDEVRDRWLDRLWEAVNDDEVPYLDTLPDYWGRMCVTEQRASKWADKLIGITRIVLSPSPSIRGHFKGTTACLSALFHAQRYDEILEILLITTRPFFPYAIWGVKALELKGQVKEALELAEKCRTFNYRSSEISMVCEEILLNAGKEEEAYSDYSFEANWKSTYLATFRAVSNKYPSFSKAKILRGLVKVTPGKEGKWFAAAKSAGLYDEAIELAQTSPCDPRTLTRAARDYAEKEPRFAMEAGMAALFWLVKGMYYEITTIDVQDAYKYSLAAGDNLGMREITYRRICDLVRDEESDSGFVTDVLEKELGLDRFNSRD